MADRTNRWTQPSAPPSLFVGKAERDFAKQLSDEVVEKIVGQQILYFPLDMERTDYHPLYGEAIKKTFLPPVRVYSLVEYVGSERVQQKYGFDSVYNLNIHLNKRRLVEDQDLFLRLGDFVQYDNMYFEIVDLFEPRYIFGQDKSFTTSETSLEVTAVARQARRGLFDAN